MRGRVFTSLKPLSKANREDLDAKRKKKRIRRSLTSVIARAEARTLAPAVRELR